jgi:hypothetical protein
MSEKVWTLRNKKDGFQAFASAIRGRESFRNSTGSLTGVPVEGGMGLSFGKLPEVWRERLDRARDSCSYIVFSYRTPIAWLSNGAWVVPTARYSVTTSQHQGLIRAALSVLSNETPND